MKGCIRDILIGVPINVYAHLKKKVDYTAKNSSALTKETFVKFLSDASHEKYLAMKVSTLAGYNKNTRHSRQVLGTVYTIPETKIYETSASSSYRRADILSAI